MTPETKSDLPAPVLVVGAGPVGLSTAMLLAQSGVRPLVVEKRSAISELARASSSLRTLEIFRMAGLWAELTNEAWRGGVPMEAVSAEYGLSTIIHRSGLPRRYAQLLERCSPVDSRLIVTQDRLQRIASTELIRRGGTIRFGAQLVGLAPGDGQVCAEVLDITTGEVAQVYAHYVVGADGAGSDVRTMAGIGVPDREAISRLNTAYYRADLRNILQAWGTHMCFVRNDSVYATVMSKNGRDEWSSHIMDYPGKPDELTELSPARTIELLRAAIGDPDLPIELHAVNAWEAAIGMASSMRQGRVFLVGDAAHVQSSAGGLGMNTGIQDGHNLAWKIAAVLHGHASPRLLDTYVVERRTAVSASLNLSRRLHCGYQHHDDPAALYERIAIDYLRAMMFYGYPPDAAEEVDFCDGTARVGYRFPHRWSPSPTGRVSTLDLLGTRWTLFVGVRSRAWQRFVTGRPMHIAIRELPGLRGAVLVRPDGFVAWRGETTTSASAALADLGVTPTGR